MAAVAGWISTSRAGDRLIAAAGWAVAVENLAPVFEPLLRQVSESCERRPIDLHPPPRRFGDLVVRIGRVTIAQVTRGAELLGFLGLVCIAALRILRHPSRLRLTALVSHMEQTGVDALPVVGLLSFLVGIVFAFQGADQLRQFGAEIYTVNLLGIAILRELGVLLTAIIIAGRSGSAFTAQIGTMQVNQEIDALRTLGLDPVEVLVLPRVFGLVVTLPLLVFYADAMGLLGGALMSWSTLGISLPRFLEQLRGAITEWTVWVGVIKAPFFALIISMIGCYEGFNVTGSAESVGRLTTQSVVESIFVVIVADAAFSILFSLLKI